MPKYRPVFLKISLQETIKIEILCSCLHDSWIAGSFDSEPDLVCLKLSLCFIFAELLTKTRNGLQSFTSVLSEHVHVMKTEAFVLERLLYIKHGQLRQEKTYQTLKQVRLKDKFSLLFGEQRKQILINSAYSYIINHDYISNIT